jgi:hypothetical protein
MYVVTKCCFKKCLLAMLDASQYPTSNYTTQQQKEFGAGTKTDMKTSGTEDPDRNPHSYIHLIFDKGAQNI